ncbi:MAG: hypothetical protein KatS3mg121_0661 [Gammaproteobacteria bacterium]|nr:MAG: hypothetical protein KatS3mg121_0661 [Gammaproteobacteria bacterium]
MGFALRPDGIAWPRRDGGEPDFRLEALSAANDLQHEQAHDALSDVRATIALARLLRRAQPRLYAHAWSLRDKRAAARWLDPAAPRPVVHSSGKFPARHACTSIVLPLARHPVNRNAVIVADLRHDPEALIRADADTLAARLFLPKEELPEGEDRYPLKLVHLNKSPMLAPIDTLDEAAWRRLALDPDTVAARARRLLEDADLPRRLAAAHLANPYAGPGDPELDLYGGLYDDADRRLLTRLRDTPPEALPPAPPFADPRLPELYFRYRARNWPEHLDEAERARWRAHCARVLHDPAFGRTLDAHRARIAELRAEHAGDARALALLDALSEHLESVAAWIAGD